ncbi:hypothetical protein [Lederbergia citri]|uniref:Uncharacterized protein n=1 Tax=Lederbergia citri TaxID=2833580 RepID=A0A942YIS7_9BACI|nr:hypothetical protein [Lederbergia citri]MBS4197314.1 hypothetical protein [Lederbergia citri]
MVYWWCRNIGDITREKRFRGYSDAHLNAGIEINPNYIINAEWQLEIAIS